MKPADDLAALAEKDALFRLGQTIARQGISKHGIPACVACHDLSEKGAPSVPGLRGKP
jgi:cytochrome c553